MPKTHQKLENTGNRISPEPLEKIQYCRHLDFRLLTPRTGRKYISFLLRL
jgi:hypothetical protein